MITLPIYELIAMAFAVFMAGFGVGVLLVGLRR